MRESWRWFGPDDPVTLDDIRQTGATDIVSALHDVPIGTAWSMQAIGDRKALIEDTPPGLRPLRGSVVAGTASIAASKLVRWESMMS